ncbi:MAG: hydroxyacid dehydrogenase [Candidatus Hodarchaeales archaeon]|jgi:D-3-phosphoglycerate dehydrogenase
MKMKVLIADSIAPTAVAELKTSFEIVEHHYTPNELLSEISNYDAVIVRSATKIPREVIEAGSKLKVIGRAGVGVDNIDVEAATEKGIYVVNSPRASTISVAEMTIALILALSRKVVEASIKTKKGKWPKKEFMGLELFGKKIGFVGCGRIGSEVAVRAIAFGMKPLIYDPYLPPELFLKFGADEITDLGDLFKESDFITVHALLNEETRGMISHDEFELMKPTAYLVNCARGGIVDEDALYDALKKGELAGAALDVFTVEPAKESKLFELENVYVSPHVAASTKEAQERAGMITAEQVRLVLKGKSPEFCVNAHDLN